MMKILLAVFLSLNVVIYSQIDKNGNPVFNSVPITIDTVNNFILSSYYYTITNNIDNPNSSVFVSEKPSDDEIINFARTKPSYYFVIQQNQVVSTMIMLLSRIEGKKSNYSFLIINPNTKKQVEISCESLGDVTEGRVVELVKKYDKQAMELKFGSKKMILFADIAYSIQPFETLKAEVVNLINKYNLYKTDVNLDELKIKD